LTEKKNHDEENEITNITNLTNISYQVEEKSKNYLLRGIPVGLWQAVKVIAAQKNTTIRNIILSLLLNFVKENAGEHLSVNISLDPKETQAKSDLLRFMIEEDIRMLVDSLRKAKQRKASNDYIRELKKQIIENVKKCPNIDPLLADEIRRVFKSINDKPKEVNGYERNPRSLN